MVQVSPSKMEAVVRFVHQKGLGSDATLGTGSTLRDWEEFTTLVMKAGREEDQLRKEAHEDAVKELRWQRNAGVLDEGQDDYDFDAASGLTLHAVDSALDRQAGGSFVSVDGCCFFMLCDALGVSVSSDVRSVADLQDHDLQYLQKSNKAMIGYSYYYETEDPRNHVFAVIPGSKSSQVKFVPCDATSKDFSAHGVTSPQEFFNKGGWLYNAKFYASGVDDVLQDTAGFGGDLPSGLGRPQNAPPAPESIANGGLSGGGANITGGVVRPKRRAIKGRSDFMTSTDSLRTYAVSSATMFNNMEEMYLNTITKEYAQEIIEELFGMWNLPMTDPTVMKYAEDALWAFLIARTASNKADYKFLMDVPTKAGDVEIDFDVFSRLLAQKYGISRRNFARGVADNLRNYLRREENQHLRSLSAQRIGADPQMGDMCFDGSTGCTSLTSSEASFARLLEARNLYERDDVIAEGASDKLMQGMSGGVRSIVPR